MSAFREQLDAYVKQKYGVVSELLPFSHEDYSIYRHTRTGRGFAVFIVKERREFGLPGNGDAEIVCFKIRDNMLADVLAQQPGYLRGYPSRKWNFTKFVIDREGNVVARFEPTADMAKVEECIKSLL